MSSSVHDRTCKGQHREHVFSQLFLRVWAGRHAAMRVHGNRMAASMVRKAAQLALVCSCVPAKVCAVGSLGSSSWSVLQGSWVAWHHAVMDALFLPWTPYKRQRM